MDAMTLDELEAIERQSKIVLPVKRRGRARVVKVVNDEGEVVAAETHDRILEALIKREGIEAEVVGAKRPATVLCVDCGDPIVVSRMGRIPVRCISCKSRIERRKHHAKNREKRNARNRAWRAKNREKIQMGRRKSENREKIRTQQRVRYAKNSKKVLEQQHAKREKRREQQRARRAKTWEKEREQQRARRAKKKAAK